MSNLSVVNLRCEYKLNPLGIDIAAPRFSWQLESDMRACMQQAYQIQVSKECTAFQSIVWDSERVAADQCVHVVYNGSQLTSRTRYYFRVKVWDIKGNESPWSEVAYFETGLLSGEDWKADWIAAPEELKEEDKTRCPLLRKDFVLKGAVHSARIYASALGLYSLYLNGQRVSEDLFTPGWTNYKKWIQYQTYDITDLLKNGSNVMGAMLGNGWYKGNIGFSGQSELYGKQLALILQMHIRYEDGGEEVVLSDNSWKTSLGPILMSEIYHGETYDARLEIPGWNDSEYSFEGWKNVLVLDPPATTLMAQVNVPVRKKERFKAVSLIITPKGERVLDFGQNMVGWVQFSVEGQPGDEVILRHAEVLDKDGNFYTENLRTAQQTIRYTVKGKDIETYEPYFTFQGFRYVMVESYPGTLDIENFTGVVIHSDMEQTGSFTCSDPMLNQLQHNILWGQKGNFLDVPTDCPQRDERLGWTGDAQVFIRTSCYNMDVASFFTKWLYDLKSEQLENGGIPFVIPNVLGAEAHSSAAWGDASAICPWTMYLCYGDTRILEEQYESIKAWVEYMKAQGEKETLWNTGFHFGDWLALDAKEGSYIGATARDYIATAFFAYSTKLLTNIAGVLKKHEDENNYDALYQRILIDFRKEFVTPNGRLSVPTQTGYVLALMFDLLEEKDRGRIIRDLVEDIKENKIHLKTGFVGTPYLCDVLSRHGYLDVAYQLLLQKDYPSWLYQIEKGATTIWEHWDGIKPDGSFWSKDMNSFNHYAYGAIGDWLYRVVAGLDIDEKQPGYKHSLIQPHPHPISGLHWVEAKLETMYGVLSSSWKLEDGKMEMTVSVPPNTLSTVILPDADINEVGEDGMNLLKSDDIFACNQVGSDVEVKIGSGKYRFHYAIAKK